MNFNLAALKKFGFEGFIRMLLASTPSCGGVYIFLRQNKRKPEFLKKGTGGKLRGNPNVEVSKLEKKWVEGAQVVYIGQTTNIRQRVKTRLEFGRGRAVRAWGGRYIWQLKDAEELLIAWKKVGPADLLKTERMLINHFKRTYGKLPFANLR